MIAGANVTRAAKVVSMTNFKARPTVYKGIQMRSRLEAGFAMWLDEEGLIWEYEPKAFAGERGQYLPDFAVEMSVDGAAPRTGYIETKPVMPGAGSVTRYLDMFAGDLPAHHLPPMSTSSDPVAQEVWFANECAAAHAKNPESCVPHELSTVAKRMLVIRESESAAPLLIAWPGLFAPERATAEFISVYALAGHSATPILATRQLLKPAKGVMRLEARRPHRGPWQGEWWAG